MKELTKVIIVSIFLFPFAKQGWDIQKRADNGASVLDGTYHGINVSPWRTTIVAKNLT